MVGVYEGSEKTLHHGKQASLLAIKVLYKVWNCIDSYTPMKEAMTKNIN